MTEVLDVVTEPVKPAQTPAPDTEPTGWMSPTGEIRDGAPENVKTLLETKKWNISQLVDGYNELEKFTGVGKHLVIPEAEDAEGWDNVYNQMGRPETHDKYEYVSDPEVLLDENLINRWKEVSHREGKTQKQFASDVALYCDIAKEAIAAEKAQEVAQKEENIAALQLKWGANYETKIKGARIIADSLGIYQTLETKGLASDPVIIEMLDKIASRTAEDVITPATPIVTQKTPQEELEELMKSESFKDKFHRDHKNVHARFMELNQIIANSGQAKRPRS